MRTWGRVQNEGTWVEVTTDANGFDDAVWLTTLAQVLLLNLGESPFFAGYGIPAQQSVVTQIFPDYYVLQTQNLFAQYFASLIINREPGPEPVYSVQVVTQQGYAYPFDQPVPI